MGAMILEIDNAMRGVLDIRKSLFTLDGRTAKPKQTIALEEARLALNELAHKIRVLEYELNNG